MNKQLALGIFGGVIVGYCISSYRWNNKRTQRSFDQIITMAHLFADNMNWVVEEGMHLEHEEFVEKLLERLTYAEIVANEI